MTQPSYIEHPMYMIQVTLKLKLNEKSDFRFWIVGLRHAMISNYPFISCKHYSMVYEKLSHSTDTTQNFLYPMSYVYDPSYTKTEIKGEI